MSDLFPDIEIYIKDVTDSVILGWLQNHFDVTPRKRTVTLTRGSETTECLIVPDAAKGGFTSVWFKSNHTPWKTDLDCAREAHKFMQKEVRCSAGSWSNKEEGWLKINQQGESKVAWE
tara:strand:- start:63 stop:416 length:354 start_codon:yes stop_codon:yes gene_type:complete